MNEQFKNMISLALKERAHLTRLTISAMPFASERTPVATGEGGSQSLPEALKTQMKNAQVST